jgi:hypothetical protein
MVIQQLLVAVFANTTCPYAFEPGLSIVQAYDKKMSKSAKNCKQSIMFG